MAKHDPTIYVLIIYIKHEDAVFFAWSKVQGRNEEWQVALGLVSQVPVRPHGLTPTVALEAN